MGVANDLNALKRFIRQTVPAVRVIRGVKMPPGLLGLVSGGVIFYNRELRGRERAITLLHELAHLVLDADHHGTLHNREQWREDRADRWAEEALADLEASAWRASPRARQQREAIRSA